MRLLRPKNILKLAWLGFGIFGLVIIAKQYFPHLWPRVRNSNLVKGIQDELALTTINQADFSDPDSSDTIDLKQLDPQEAGQVIAKVLGEQITEFIKKSTTEVKEYPAKQVKKIKIGACEELLEEDICSVAAELDCQP